MTFPHLGLVFSLQRFSVFAGRPSVILIKQTVDSRQDDIYVYFVAEDVLFPFFVVFRLPFLLTFSSPISASS